MTRIIGEAELRDRIIAQTNSFLKGEFFENREFILDYINMIHFHNGKDLVYGDRPSIHDIERIDWAKVYFDYMELDNMKKFDATDEEGYEMINSAFFEYVAAYKVSARDDYMGDSHFLLRLEEQFHITQLHTIDEIAPYIINFYRAHEMLDIKDFDYTIPGVLKARVFYDEINDDILKEVERQGFTIEGILAERKEHLKQTLKKTMTDDPVLDIPQNVVNHYYRTGEILDFDLVIPEKSKSYAYRDFPKYNKHVKDEDLEEPMDVGDPPQFDNQSDTQAPPPNDYQSDIGEPPNFDTPPDSAYEDMPQYDSPPDSAYEEEMQRGMDQESPDETFVSSMGAPDNLDPPESVTNADNGMPDYGNMSAPNPDMASMASSEPEAQSSNEGRSNNTSNAGNKTSSASGQKSDKSQTFTPKFKNVDPDRDELEKELQSRMAAGQGQQGQPMIKTDPFSTVFNAIGHGVAGAFSSIKGMMPKGKPVSQKMSAASLGNDCDNVLSSINTAKANLDTMQNPQASVDERNDAAKGFVNNMNTIFASEGKLKAAEQNGQLDSKLDAIKTAKTSLTDSIENAKTNGNLSDDIKDALDKAMEALKDLFERIFKPKGQQAQAAPSI